MYTKQEYILLQNLKDAKLIDPLTISHAIIAGGAIRSVFANEFISDYDIYFKSTLDLITFEYNLIQLENVELSFQTDVAKTYNVNKLKIQVIIMPELICSNAKDIIDQFDYTVCMGAYDFDTKQFVLNDRFIEHIARRELSYNVNGKYPLGSLFRLRKYLKKGYTISGTEIIKLGLSINNLKMESYIDLKKQLEGIDTLFLKELTDKLLSPEYAEKKFDFSEFMDMIDKFFTDKLEEVFE